MHAGGLYDTKHLCKLQPRLVPVNSLGGAFTRTHSPEFSRDVSTALQVPHSLCERLAMLTRPHAVVLTSLRAVQIRSLIVSLRCYHNACWPEHDSAALRSIGPCLLRTKLCSRHRHEVWPRGMPFTCVTAVAVAA